MWLAVVLLFLYCLFFFFLSFEVVFVLRYDLRQLMKAVIFFSTETVKGFLGGFSNFFVYLSYEEMMRENSIQVRNPYLSTGECRYLTLVLWAGEKERNVTTCCRSVQFFFFFFDARFPLVFFMVI